jgi:hypothetical protein
MPLEYYAQLGSAHIHKIYVFARRQEQEERGSYMYSTIVTRAPRVLPWLPTLSRVARPLPCSPWRVFTVSSSGTSSQWTLWSYSIPDLATFAPIGLGYGLGRGVLRAADLFALRDVVSATDPPRCYIEVLGMELVLWEIDATPSMRGLRVL